MYVDEPPKDGNIPDFNISKIDICPFRAYQRSFRLFQGDFSTDIHQRSRLLCFTQNDHTGQTGFKICSFLKWGHSLNNAIYIGTPAAISLRQSDRVLMTSLAHKVVHVNEKGSEITGKQELLHSINKMIDGSIVEKENFDAVDLVYHSNNGKDIRIEDIASGFKPLVYMLRLIENGWLTENTLLEIDEPETNLHPQWVVELAHLLVRINKTFGTKILITSHNPDMVSAIRYISEKEGLLNTTRFYLAEQSEGTDSFYYKNLGCDIEPVFESFNKSFDTLQKYVENYGEI